MNVQDEKKEGDGDVEMKPEEEAKPSTSSTPKRKEPSSESLPNFSRVTPAQLAYIKFPPDGRYQPVRPVSIKPPPPPASKNARSKAQAAAMGLTTEAYIGGAGILIMDDRRPGEPVEFVEFEAVNLAGPPTEAAPEAPAAGATQGAGRHIALDDGPEAEPPAPFEVWVCITVTRGIG